MRALLILLLASCQVTPSTFVPNRVYVERGDGEFTGSYGDQYDDET
jgi:hypothetical protein